MKWWRLPWKSIDFYILGIHTSSNRNHLEYSLESGRKKKKKDFCSQKGFWKSHHAHNLGRAGSSRFVHSLTSIGYLSPWEPRNSRVTAGLGQRAWCGHAFKTVSFLSPFLPAHLPMRWWCPQGSVWALWSAQAMQSSRETPSIHGSSFSVPPDPHLRSWWDVPCTASPGYSTGKSNLPHPQIQIISLGVAALTPCSSSQRPASPSLHLPFSPPSGLTSHTSSPYLLPEGLSSGPLLFEPREWSWLPNGFLAPIFVFLQIHFNNTMAGP